LRGFSLGDADLERVCKHSDESVALGGQTGMGSSLRPENRDCTLKPFNCVSSVSGCEYACNGKIAYKRDVKEVIWDRSRGCATDIPEYHIGNVERSSRVRGFERRVSLSNCATSFAVVDKASTS
jgi:hypothetical protein